MRYVRDVMDHDGNFITKHEFDRKTGLITNFLKFGGFIGSIKFFFNRQSRNSQ